MTTLIIEIPEKEKDTVLGFLKKHGVKVQEPDKELTREEVLADLERGLQEVKDRIDGKLKRKPKTLSQIINGI